jgi:methylmalonyl-CoA/ethylmalonyl-CoA epimerase
MKKQWKLSHLGFVVKDMDQVTSYYERLGIGTVGPIQWIRTPDGGRVKTCFVKVGSLEIEFLQPVEGEGPSSQFLKKHGEGINHLAFTVRDIDREIEDLKNHGVRLMFRLDVPDYGKIAYFDTGELGGVVMELVKPI